MEACLKMNQNPLEFILGKPNDESKIGHPPYYRSFHQRRLPNASIKLVYDALLDKYEQLIKSEDFATLYNEVCEFTSKLEAEPECGKKGLQFRQLCCYDLSLRIAYYEITWKRGSLKLLPDSVYLHSGVIKGIEALWSHKGLDEGYIRLKKGKKAVKSKISLSELQAVKNIPPELFDLAPKGMDEAERISKLPMHLENFLCLYHYQLKSLAETLTKEEEAKFNQHVEKFNKRKNKCQNKN